LSLTIVFTCVSPWVIRFVYSEVYFLVVVAVKWLVIGATAAGEDPAVGRPNDARHVILHI